jgi:putative glutamine amidotransferase
MAKPLIGITGRRWPASSLSVPLPATFEKLHFDLHFTDYPASVAAAGGLPVELARDADAEGVVERLDGLVLTGGADVDPSLYGAEPDINLGSLERDRDEWELALFRAARARDLPILAICRGVQLANVALGGTLNQHVDADEGVGHPQWDSDANHAVHEVDLVAGSVLASLLPTTTGVNSLHHQTIGRVGDGLVVSAKASDGVIEGLEMPGADFLGVQWHPELLGGPDPTFVWLVTASRRFMNDRVAS